MDKQIEHQGETEEKLVRMADDDILPSNSSHSESQTLYVGDVDEQAPPMNKIAETNKAENDENSFVVVDASPANDDDDLDLDALLDDSVEDNADADLDALLIDSFDGNIESDAALKRSEEEAAKARAEAAKKKAEEEAAAAAAAAAALKKAEEETTKKKAEAKQKAEEEAATVAAEAEAKKKAEDEAAAAAKKKAEDEASKAKAIAEAEAEKKAEEEAAAAAKKKAENEAAKAKAVAEAEAKKKAEEEAAKAKAAAAAEARKKAEERAAKAKAAAAAKKKAEDEAAKAKALAEAEAKKKAEDEAAAAAKKKAEDEATKAKAFAEAEAKKKAEEEATKAKAAAAAEARKKAEERAAKAKAAAAAKKKADEEAAAAAEAEARKKAEERAAKVKAAAGAKKKADEKAAKAKAAAALKKAEEEVAKAKAAAEAEAKKKAEEEAAAKAIEDTHALELDALLDDSDKEDHHDAEPEILEDKPPSQITSDNKDETYAMEDTHALELDALLDDYDEEDHNDVGPEVVEDKPPSQVSSTKNNKNASTRKKTDSKASNGGGRVGLPGLSSRMGNAIKNTPRKNMSSSVSDTLTNSKNKVITARDRMKEYSQKISNRASNQMRKNTKPKWGESWNNNELRSYMKTTAAFTQNVVEGRIMRQNNVEVKVAEVEKDIAFKTKHNVGRPPMKSSSSSQRLYNYNVSSRATSGTVSSINRVTNTLFERRRKAKERELEMKKCTPNTTPRDGDMGKRTPFSFLISPQKARPNIFREKEESIVFTPEASRDRYINHARSYGANSVASYSSLCTVESFVNPQRAGIAGCQNKYEPLLHNMKGPCELCVFRLSDAEKEELDAKGRHLMVQFTRGGCQDCSAFPKDVGEPPVRLCTKCYNASHRRVPQTNSIRRRKKRNGAYYGY